MNLASSTLVGALSACALLSAGFPSTQEANAQFDPRQLLGGVIQQLQTGTPNPSWYGPQLWQTIAIQTNNTGIYPPLVQLGPVANITVTNQIQLPAGPVFSMTVQHQNGVSTWNFGISTTTNRIEYANFNMGNNAMPLPNPNPTPSPGNPNPNPNPGSSPACQKFPNLW
jgi:hypothetical protein